MVRSLKEAARELDRWAEKARKFLPLSRGGQDPNPQGGGRHRPKPTKARPLTKTFQFTPTVPSEPFTGDVRWRPTPNPWVRAPQEMTRVTIEDDMREIFENVDDLTAQEIAEEIYQTAEQTQNQDMENALAKIEGRRPRQFQVRSRSRQFSRLNLMPAPKKKRKVSAYSREFGKQLKRLKKLHPRTKIQNLMSKAHRRTRAEMKK